MKIETKLIYNNTLVTCRLHAVEEHHYIGAKVLIQFHFHILYTVCTLYCMYNEKHVLNNIYIFLIYNNM